MTKNNLKNKKACPVKLQRSRGFTLVETLVAIAILTLSIAGTFTAVQGGLATSIYARDQVTAFYLIQDAVEYIRNVRDDNALFNLNGGNVDWLNGLSACFSPNVCAIDTSSTNITSVVGASPTLSLDNSGRFGYNNSGISSRFSRDITIQNIVLGREAAMYITVKWTTSSMFSGGHITVKTELFNTR